MASGSDPRRTPQRVQDDDRVDRSTPQQDTPSNKRLANIPKEAFENAADSLKRNISFKDNNKILKSQLEIVWVIVKGALKKDPKLSERLANEKEFRDNVTRKGENPFIDSLRAMAANSDTQGSKAWEELFEDGTSFILLFVFKHSDCILCLDVFLKKPPAPNVDISHKAVSSSPEGGT